jgi:hypothetical protein
MEEQVFYDDVFVMPPFPSVFTKKKVGASGTVDEIVAMGELCHVESKGFCDRIVSIGSGTTISSSGFRALITSLGDLDSIVSSGKFARITSSGNFADIFSSGYFSTIFSIGNDTKIRSTGRRSVIVSSGNRVKVCASVGSWITLTEWDETDDEYCDIITRVKTEFVDGVKIKGDAWYTFFRGKFVEIEENTDLSSDSLK